MISITHDAIKGRCYTLKEPVKAGEIILRDKALVSIADEAALQTTCSFCLEPRTDFKCPDCRCSYHTNCYHQDSYHSKECSWIQKLSFDAYTNDFVRLLMRLFIQQKQESILDFCDNISSFPLHRLESFIGPALFLGEFLADFELQDIEQPFVTSFLTSKGVEPTPRVVTALVYICKEECNSFGLYHHSNGQRHGYGLAIFSSAVYFNHSCIPNVGHVTVKEDGPEMVFFALEDLPAGTEATISYVSLNDSFQERSLFIKDYFMFECGCSRCLGERQGKQFKLFSCPKCSCHYVPGKLANSEKKWVCSSCS